MGQPSVWVIEYQLEGRWLMHDDPMTFSRKDIADLECAKRRLQYPGWYYRVGEYRRVEPAPRDSGAGEKE